MGVVILRIKEVTPEKIPQRFSSFWQEHVKTHRNYLRTQRGSVKTKSHQDSKNTLTLLEEVRDVLNVVDSDEDGLEDTFLQTLFEKARQDTDYADILRATGKPAPIQNPMALQRMLSRRTTVAHNNDGRNMSILNALRSSGRHKIKEDFATSPSKHFVRSDSNEGDDINNDTLYRQAKMIQRSRSIGTGLSRRRRHKVSRKIKTVQIMTQDISNQQGHTSTPQEPNKEEALPIKSDSTLSETVASKRIENKPNPTDVPETSL